MGLLVVYFCFGSTTKLDKCYLMAKKEMTEKSRKSQGIVATL